MTTLNVATLPFDQTVACDDGTVIVMRELLVSIRPVIEILAGANLIKTNDSFGFAMLEPRLINEAGFNEFTDDYDDPKKYIWYVGGWGPNRDRYIANAIRKLRPMIRTSSISTLNMRSESPEMFEGVVPSVDADGSFPWGDFPWGGATSFDMCGLLFEGAVSALHEIEDDIVAMLIMGILAKKIILGVGLLPNA